MRFKFRYFGDIANFSMKMAQVQKERMYILFVIMDFEFGGFFKWEGSLTKLVGGRVELNQRDIWKQ